jgi:hypothetical protein
MPSEKFLLLTPTWNFEEEGEGGRMRRQRTIEVAAAALSKVKPQAVTSGSLPTWGPPQGTQMFILLLVHQKVDHEIVFPPSGSNSTQQLATVTFMWG